MEQLAQKERNMLIWKVAGVVSLLFACTCMGGLALFGGIFGTLLTIEKTYYPECEKFAGGACQTCCEERGHSGYSSGEIMNEPGKQCGCL